MLESPTEGRRRNMAAIRSKDTRPELHVRRRVHAAGFRFRLPDAISPVAPTSCSPEQEQRDVLTIREYTLERDTSRLMRRLEGLRRLPERASR